MGPLYPLALCLTDSKCLPSAWVYCLAERGGPSLPERQPSGEERHSGRKERHFWAQGEERLRASPEAVEALGGGASGSVWTDREGQKAGCWPSL